MSDLQLKYFLIVLYLETQINRIKTSYNWLNVYIFFLNNWYIFILLIILFVSGLQENFLFMINLRDKN